MGETAEERRQVTITKKMLEKIIKDGIFTLYKYKGNKRKYNLLKTKHNLYITKIIIRKKLQSLL